jgi:hypothetical protein
MKFIFVLMILFTVHACSQSPYTLRQKNLGVRDTIYFEDILSGRPNSSGRSISDDSANNRVRFNFKTLNFNSYQFDSSTYTGIAEIEWYGSNNRVVASIDRGGTLNAPSLLIDVADSVGAVNSNHIFAAMRALNSNKTKTMAHFSTVTNGTLFLSGRRDSSATFNTFAFFSNDSSKLFINGVPYIRLDAAGMYWDSSSSSGVYELGFKGSSDRVVGYIDRAGTKNAPSITIDVADSVGAVNSANIFVAVRALNSNKTKAMSHLSAVTSGSLFLSGRRDSSATFNTYVFVNNDTFKVSINGTERARITEDGSWQETGMMRGSDAFTTTATADTVTITGATSSDYYWVTPKGSSITSNDVLSVTAGTNTLIVNRPASGTSGLGYNWLRRK